MGDHQWGMLNVKFNKKSPVREQISRNLIATASLPANLTIKTDGQKAK